MLKYSTIFKYLFVLIFIIDMLNGFLLRNSNLPISIGQIYRFFVILVMLYFIFTKITEFQFRQNIKFSLFVIYFLFMQFVYVFFHGNFKGLFNDIINVTLLFLPLLIIHAFKIRSFSISIIDEIFNINIWLFSLSLIIPKILGVGYINYEYAGVGYQGFYFDGNSLSIIMIVFFVFSFDKFLSKFSLINLCNVCINLFSLILIGSKTSLFFSILGMFILVIRYLFNRKISKVKIFTTILISIFAISLVLYSYWFELNLVVSNQMYLMNRYTNNGIFSYLVTGRDNYFNIAYNNYINSDNIIIVTLFGVGKYYKTLHEHLNEMDIVDIFFWFGIIGTILIYGYYFKIFIKSRKKDNIFVYKLSFILMLIFSTLGGHVMFSALAGSILALLCCKLNN
jgi:hypothetical protein